MLYIKTKYNNENGKFESYICTEEYDELKKRKKELKEKEKELKKRQKELENKLELLSKQIKDQEK